jgi:hypothetical protein
MNLLNKIFDAIGRAITSLAAVIFVMLMTITGMILFSHTLFAQIFPAGMNTWEKISATWFMALGWEFTVLITTCNTKHINRHVPAIMAICSGIIVLFFIQAFDGAQPPLILAQRWFVGILAATINYIYADLFYAKWKERKDLIELPIQVNDLQAKLIERERILNLLQSEYNEVVSKLTIAQRDLLQLQRYKQNADAELICPYCNVAQANAGSLRAHKGHCSAKQKNK